MGLLWITKKGRLMKHGRSKVFKIPWNKVGLPKINTLCWELLDGKVLTAENLKKKGHPRPIKMCTLCIGRRGYLPYLSTMFILNGGLENCLWKGQRHFLHFGELAWRFFSNGSTKLLGQCNQIKWQWDVGWCSQSTCVGPFGLLTIK